MFKNLFSSAKSSSMEGAEPKKRKFKPVHFDANFKYYLDGLHDLHQDMIIGKENELPNCFIIGAGKSGTTTLADTLRKHPSIFVSSPKEPKFFGPAYPLGWEAYFALFRKAKGAPVRIDASVRYGSGMAEYLGTPRMIKNYIRDPKFIYIARHPMDRIVSHWRHWKGRSPKLYGPFNNFMDVEREKRLFLESSLYYKRITRYRNYFDDTAILCVAFEDMINDPKFFLERVLSFLGQSSDAESIANLLENGAFPRENAAGTGGRNLVPKPDWDPAVFDRVKEIVSPDARQFLAYMGKPGNYWEDL